MTGAADDVVVPVEIAQKYSLGGATLLGATGARYRGRDASNGREVVAVTLRFAAFGSTAERLRVRRELDALVKVREPGVAPVLASGETPAGLWYVREWVPGEGLAARLGRMGPLAPRAAAHIARGINTALGRLHARRIMHRGVQPSGVVLGTDDAVTLVDAALGPPFSNSVGAVDAAAYLAPEVAAGRLAGISSDLYGVGATLVAMLTGRAPDPEKLVGDGDTPPPDVAAPLDRIVAQLLARESRRRPATTRQVEALLAAVAPQLGSTRDSVVTVLHRLRPDAVTGAGAGGASQLKPPVAIGAVDGVPALPTDGTGDETEDELTDIAKGDWPAPPPPRPSADETEDEPTDVAPRAAPPPAVVRAADEPSTVPAASPLPASAEVPPRAEPARDAGASSDADETEDEPTDVAPRAKPPPPLGVEEPQTEPAALPAEEPTTPRERDARWPGGVSAARPPAAVPIATAPLPARLPPPPPVAAARGAPAIATPAPHAAAVDEASALHEVPTTVTPQNAVTRVVRAAAAGRDVPLDDGADHDDADHHAVAVVAPVAAIPSAPMPASPQPSAPPSSSSSSSRWPASRAGTPPAAHSVAPAAHSVAPSPYSVAPAGPAPSARPRSASPTPATASLSPMVASVPPLEAPSGADSARLARVARRAFWSGVFVGVAAAVCAAAGVFAARAVLGGGEPGAAVTQATATPPPPSGALAAPSSSAPTTSDAAAAAPSTAPETTAGGARPGAPSAGAPRVAPRPIAPSAPLDPSAPAAPSAAVVHDVVATSCGADVRRNTPLAHAQQALAAGDIAEARRALERLAPRMPNVWQVHCMLAEVHTRANERSGAVRELRIAAQLASRSAPSLRRIAQMQSAARDRDGEIITLEMLCSADRRDADAHERLVMLRALGSRRRR